MWPVSASVTRAEFAKGYLDDAGIESILVVERRGGNLGLALENDAGIMVKTEDLVRAREVLVEAGSWEMTAAELGGSPSGPGG